MHLNYQLPVPEHSVQELSDRFLVVLMANNSLGSPFLCLWQILNTFLVNYLKSLLHYSGNVFFLYLERHETLIARLSTPARLSCRSYPPEISFLITCSKFPLSTVLGSLKGFRAYIARFRPKNSHLWFEKYLWWDNLQFFTPKIPLPVNSIISRNSSQSSQLSKLSEWKVGVLLLLHMNRFVLIAKS